jgi:hypothetical protein
MRAKTRAELSKPNTHTRCMFHEEYTLVGAVRRDDRLRDILLVEQVAEPAELPIFPCIAGAVVDVVGRIRHSRGVLGVGVPLDAMPLVPRIVPTAIDRHDSEGCASPVGAK